ncbi:MAG: hypothetical protein H7326_03155 [Bdellovibrionaceae bacterium]|nr:hypothetical protein [Pseudobdellovibrionaceae bacterium]
MKYYTLIAAGLFLLHTVPGMTVQAQAIDNSWSDCASDRCAQGLPDLKRKNDEAKASLAFAKRLSENMRRAQLASKQDKQENQRSTSVIARTQIAVPGMAKITEEKVTDITESTQKEKVLSESSISTLKNGAAQAEKVIESSPIANQCSKFAGDDEFKVWGDHFRKNFDHKKFSALYGQPKSSNINEAARHKGPADLLRLCPKYDQMNDDQKDGLWIVFAVPWVFFESSCNSGAVNGNATNGIAQGLLQLHKGKEQKYSGGCRQGDATDPARTFQCGLSMLNDQVLRGENVLSSATYWEVLRPQSRNVRKPFKDPPAQFIMKKICQYPSCGQTETECNKLVNTFVAQARSEANAKSSTAKRSAAQKNTIRLAETGSAK